MTTNLQGFATIPRSMLYDPEIPHDAKLVYLILSSHVGGSEMAWPSHRRIGDLLGMGVSTVKRQLEWLREHGYLAWERRSTPDGASLTNRYTLLVGSKPTPADTGSPERATPSPERAGGVAHSGLGGSPERATERESKNESHKNEELLFADADVGGTPEPEPEPKRTRTKDRTDSPEFVAFWQAYPRRVGKGDARDKFRAALERGVPLETIMTGVFRYATAVRGKDARYVANPATWLNQERWDDEAPGQTFRRAASAGWWNT